MTDRNLTTKVDLPFNETLHTPFTLERQQRQTKRDIPPLSLIRGSPEPLTQLFNDGFRLFILSHQYPLPIAHQTFMFPPICPPNHL